MSELYSEKQGRFQAYHPIRLVRSDGQDYDYESLTLQDLPGEALQDNDDTDRANRQKWEIVLGLFLKEQLAPSDDKREYKLGTFPRGYELRSSKKTSDDTKRDYYLFGHPLGAKHRYRSPADFFPHLLWLSGDSEDYHDCSCEFCTKLAEKMRTRVAQAATGMHVAPVQNSQPPRISANPAAATTTASPLSASAARSAPPTGKAPSSAPPSVPVGMTGETHMFRNGEMVWYRTKAWRLGVIVSIAIPASKSRHSDGGMCNEAAITYRVAPIGHYLLNAASLKMPWNDMRPFLTFSVPVTTLQGLPGKAFWEVDWPSFTRDPPAELGERERATWAQMAGLEASKMAARCVNDSFSCFNAVPGPPQQKEGYRQYLFNGVFLGAEMIHVGDAVRVNDKAADAAGAITIMRVGEMRVRAHDAKNGQQQRELEFAGSTYRLVHGSTAGAAELAAVEAPLLGRYFEEELAGQNRYKPGWKWVTIEPGAVRSETDVHGRAYVSHRLLPQVDAQRWEARQITTAPQCLNKRAHSGSCGARHLGCQKNREATFGASIGDKFAFPATIREAFPQ